VQALFPSDRDRKSPAPGRKHRSWPLAALLLCATAGLGTAASAAPGTAVGNEDGKYVDAEGNPTYNIAPDGKLDWYTFSGYRRYHSECHVCHGPDGAGSTYAPALSDSMKNLNYEQFVTIVVQGRTNVGSGNQKVMPSFGENRNVMCYLDDIYVYLRARGDGALGRVRPEAHDPKPESAKSAEAACMGN